jgi:putative tryptophan/tyrosine transport system substrate-binding protein
MDRREIITLLGGAAAWPLAARAQQPERMRRIGVLMNYTYDNLEGQARLGLFVNALQRLGWIDGRTARIDIRWAGDDRAHFKQYASELLAAAPDVILAHASPSVAALQQVSQSVPIVFTSVIDPVGAGFVESLARPGGNTTGFALFEYTIAGKWLELLKEIAPGVTQVAVLRDPTIAAGIGQFAAIQAAGVIGIDLSVMDIRDGAVIERGVATFARSSNRGLIVTASPFGANNPDFIATLATRYKLPAIFPFRYFVTAGGLLSYGPDTLNLFSPAANYVSRILKGEKPADMPVQAPTKYELLINIRTAKALGMTIPAAVLARADEVIE